MIDMKTGEKVILTKERAIKEHRRMWRWIAKQYEKGSREKVFKLKEAYLNGKYEDVEADCFCCEYDVYLGEYSCDNCPIKWEAIEKGYDAYCQRLDSPYHKLVILSNSSISFDCKEAAKLTREIANLPERE